MSADKDKPDQTAISKKLGRRDFLKYTALVWAELAATQIQFEPFVRQVRANEGLTSYGAAQSAASLFDKIPGQRNLVWTNFSAPREVRGIAASGNYVVASGYGLVGRIDIRDNKTWVYDAKQVPPFSAEAGQVGSMKRPMAVERKENGNIWLGTTDNGAYYFDGVKWTQYVPRFKVNNTKVELYRVSLIQVDERGDLWFGGTQGLLKLDKAFDPNLDLDAQGYILPELGREKLRLGSAEIRNNPDGIGERLISGLVEDIAPGASSGFIWLTLLGLDVNRLRVNVSSDGKMSLQDVLEIHDSNVLSRIPGGYCTDMLKDAAGKIWVSTVYGAVRLEGNPASNDKDSLFVFYNPFNYGPATSSFRVAKPVTELNLNGLDKADKFKPGRILSLAQDQNGNLWFLTARKGLARTKSPEVLKKANGLTLDDLLFYPQNSLPEYPPNNPSFVCATVDAISETERNFWIGSSEGVSKLNLDGANGPRFDKLIELFNSGQRSDHIYSVAIGKESDPHLRLKWFATERGLYSYNNQGDWLQPPEVKDQPLYAVVVDKNNAVWFGGKDGVWRREVGGGVNKLAGAAQIWCLAIDQTGTLWAGTEKGLFKWNGSSFGLEGLAGQAITALNVSPDGVLWLGSRAGQLYRQGNYAGPEFSFDGHPVQAILAEKNGAIWVGTGENKSMLENKVPGAYGSLHLCTVASSSGPVSAISSVSDTGLAVVGISVTAIARDIKGRLWVGTEWDSLSILEADQNPYDGSNWIHIGTEYGLVYNNVTALAFEPNLYKADPSQYDPTREDIVWIGTQHGISQFAVATPQTNFEPNDDRFVGFPLTWTTQADGTKSIKIESSIEIKFDHLSDIDWFKIPVDKRYSRIRLTLLMPNNAPYDLDLVLYPPGRKSSGSSTIFGGLDDTGNQADCPLGDTGNQADCPTGTDKPKLLGSSENPGFDSSFIQQRNSIVASSNKSGNKPEYIEALLTGPRGDYQVGVVAHAYKSLPASLKEASYTLTIELTEPAQSPPPDLQGRGRLYLNLLPLDNKLVDNSIKTLAITHSGRFGSSNIVDLLKSLGSSVRVIDLNLADPSGLVQPEIIQGYYNKWDGKDPATANQICAAIRAMIIQQAAYCPNLEYLIIAGSDKVVPFYRAEEKLYIGQESSYVDPTQNKNWPFGVDEPITAALSREYHLTDNFYAAMRDLPFKSRDIFIPELAIGRLVETYDEIKKQVDNYKLGPASISNALVTGYDFLSEAARNIAATLNKHQVTTDGTLISDTWTAPLLRDRLTKKRDLIVLNGHFDHSRALTANYESKENSNKLFAATEVTTYPLDRVLVASVGCHSGLDVPGVPNFAQALAAKGAILIGNTGYGYGDSDVVIYSALLIQNLVKQLTLTPQVGVALMLAKQQYLKQSAQFGFGEYDIKVLNISTLYGIPMQEFKIPPEIGGQAQIAPAVAALPAPIKAFNTASDNYGLLKTVEKFDFGGKFALQDKLRGSYYTLPALDGLVQAQPGRPVLPKAVRQLSFNDGYEPHGALLIQAKYQELYDFTPLITNPTADINLDTATEDLLDRDFYGGEGWFPASLELVNRRQFSNINPAAKRVGVDLGKAKPTAALVVTPMQFRNPDRARLYSSLEYEVYSSRSVQRLGPQVSETKVTLSGGQANIVAQIVPRSPTFPLPEVVRALITYTFISPNQSEGEWLTKDMQLDPSDPTRQRWSGSLNVGGQRGIFFIQALDSDGNVTCATNKGLYDSWVDQASFGPPRTFRASLEAVGGCKAGKVEKLRLFLQAAGDELGAGVNRIFYRITFNNGKPPIEGFIRDCWGIVEFAAEGLSGIEYWAEDTSQPPKRESGLGGGSRRMFFVTTGSDSGSGSFRQALTEAKAGDSIFFRLPPRTDGIPPQLRVEKPLPIITQKDLTIDALFPACDGNPILELSNEGSVDSGLVVRATGVTIRGFYISGFNKYDIWLDGEAKSTSQGTNPRRCVIEQNVLSNRTDHRIGIALIGDCFGNIIRGNQLIRCNDSAGLLIRGLKARYNRVVGNLLGTNRQGDDSLAQAYGVWLDQGANNNTIGGAKKGEANYISGNYEYGVLISGKDTAANRVTANKIGVSPYDDKSPLGNQRAGVKIEKQAHDNRLDGNLFLDNNNGLHIWSGAHTNQIFFNTFQSNREREIWIGENSNDAAQENWLLGNTLKHARIPVQLGERLGAPPAKPNAGVQTPRNFTASLAGSTVKVTGGAGSTNPNAAVEVYLARKLDPAAYDYLFLGSFQAGGGGELNATLPLQNVGPLKPGDQLALIATAGNGNTSEFSSPVAL